jgi:hypothetical protein
MHKGRLYELWPEYRTFCGEYPYPAWAPARWKISTATWSGSAAALAPGAPLYLTPTGVNASLEACYECPLFNSGGGVRATLLFFAYLSSPTHCRMRVGGDWGVNGSLPNDGHYNFDFPWDPFAASFLSSGTPAEAYLRPTTLIWDADPY